MPGITAAYVYGSWAARHAGQSGQRPVGDIDVLVLGDPDRDRLYEALSAAERRLGRPVEATIREPSWLESGAGSFHDTVTSRPMLKLDLPSPLAKPAWRRLRTEVEHHRTGLLVPTPGLGLRTFSAARPTQPVNRLALGTAEQRLGRPVEVTIREPS